MSSIPAVTIYGNYLSQPSRAVLWALKMKGVPFGLNKMNPMSGETDKPEFLAKFPTGYIPALYDSSSDFAVSEAPAILQYLATKHGWDDIYPCITPHTPATEYANVYKRQALVSQWLNWQHGNLRFATVDVFRPYMVARMKQMGASTRLPPGETATTQQRPPSALTDPAVKKALSEREARKVAHFWKDAMLTLTHGPLAQGSPYFLPGATSPTAADLCAYCEMDQIYYADMFDFKAYPVVYDWMGRMREAPLHDDVRQTLFKFLNLNKCGEKEQSPFPIHV